MHGHASPLTAKPLPVNCSLRLDTRKRRLIDSSAGMFGMRTYQDRHTYLANVLRYVPGISSEGLRYCLLYMH